MDPMNRFDEKDMSDDHARVSEMKADAIRMIEEMPGNAFEDWWELRQVDMDDAATQAHNASEARRFQIDGTEGMPSNAERGDAAELRARRFASATLYHEEPCW